MSWHLWANRKASPSNATPPRGTEIWKRMARWMDGCFPRKRWSCWPAGQGAPCPGAQGTPPLQITAGGWFCTWFRKKQFQTFVGFSQPRCSSSSRKLRRCFPPHLTASGIERIRRGTNPASLRSASSLQRSGLRQLAAVSEALLCSVAGCGSN